ncbi:MAG TPA: HypC/HybG/HupF family hydrogenase formation chaperone [Ktedonobacteraceae bacterium]|nr:HypC/HybG/HupF family hydrogenase formation chaperone [Ktedonobacteraceae bacterium]
MKNDAGRQETISKGAPQKLEMLSGMTCQPDAGGHCITCSDEAVAVKVLQVEQESGLALVEVGDQTEEVDITLVEHVAPGDLLLVHGGIAIGLLEEANNA